MISIRFDPKVTLALCYFFSFATVALGFVVPSFWAALLATCVIVCLAFIAFGRQWTDVLGLIPSWQGFRIFFGSLVFALFCVCSLLLLIQSPQVSTQWIALSGIGMMCVTILLQSLTEEVLFRVYVLRHFLLPQKKNLPLIGVSVDNVCSSRRLLFAVLLMSFFFSLLHVANYYLSENVILSWSPLMSLFFLGGAGSLIYIRTGTLWGSWGFHAGWNILRFSFVFSVNDRMASESETFEILEGSGFCIALSAVIFSVSLMAIFYPPLAAKARR
jgi:membrane protease YdiL (CAAX protease family)